MCGEGLDEREFRETIFRFFGEKGKLCSLPECHHGLPLDKKPLENKEKNNYVATEFISKFAGELKL